MAQQTKDLPPTIGQVLPLRPIRLVSLRLQQWRPRPARPRSALGHVARSLAAALAAGGLAVLRPMLRALGWWTHNCGQAMPRFGRAAMSVAETGTGRCARGVHSAAVHSYAGVDWWTQRCERVVAQCCLTAASAASWWVEHCAVGLASGVGAVQRGSERAVDRLAVALAAGAVVAKRSAAGWVVAVSVAVVATSHALLRATAWWSEAVRRGLATLPGRPAYVGVVMANLTVGALVSFSLLLLAVGPVAADFAERSLGMELNVKDQGGFPVLGERSVVYAADGSVLALLHDEVNRKITTIEEIPEPVWQAFVTAEDRRFFEHEGYDLEGIARAAMANLRAGGVTQGGSTITQQLAKMNFTGGEQTVRRKVNEVFQAIALEENLPKMELLERYLNQVYFGSGAYGIAAAAEEFFGVEVGELDVGQGALLASVIRAPSALNPRTNPAAAEQRRDLVLDAMVVEGYLDPADARAAKGQPIEVQDRQIRDVAHAYVVEAVKREFLANPEFGETRAERVEKLFSGGLRIHATVDPGLQAAAEEAVRSEFPDLGKPTGALAAVDPADGRILAAYSGRSFDDDQYDLALQGRRQPGSAFKTFVLAAALEQGWKLDDEIDASSPITLDFGGLEDWTVHNYNDQDLGEIELLEALTRSSNTAFAQLMLEVGQEEVEDVAGRLGVNLDRALGAQRALSPAIALGGVLNGLTPLEMAVAYGVFSAEGQRADPHVIDRVETADGAVLFETPTSSTRVLDAGVSRDVREALRSAVENGTGRAARIEGRDVAGKTGTTQLFADAWFVGTTPELSAAVWVGHPGSRVAMEGMTGGSAPARIWRAFAMSALEALEEAED